MSKDIRDLLEKRGSVIDSMQNLLNKAESENRDLNDTEQESYNKMDSEQQELKNRADRLSKANELKNSLEQIQGDSIKANVSGTPASKFAKDEYKNTFMEYARNGQMTSDVRNALQVGTNSEGGFIVPEEFETMLIRQMQDINPIRQWCNVITTASDRNIPIESTLGTATWTAEEAPYTESDAAFSQVILNSYKLTSLIKVSEELLEDSFFDLQSYLATNFADRFGLAEEAAFVNGDGSGKPTGIVGGATSSGVTFASGTAITSDELIDLQHGLTRPYRANSVWLVNDSTLKAIRKLKNSDGDYIWRAGLLDSAPDTLLGRPIYSSTAMPEMGTANKSVIVGDLSGYTIADRSQRTMQRLNELYAANGQVGFRMFSRTDGKVTDGNKIKFANHTLT